MPPEPEQRVVREVETNLGTVKGWADGDLDQGGNATKTTVSCVLPVGFQGFEGRALTIRGSGGYLELKCLGSQERATLLVALEVAMAALKDLR